jgi:hypothetical protein
MSATGFGSLSRLDRRHNRLFSRYFANFGAAHQSFTTLFPNMPPHHTHFGDMIHAQSLRYENMFGSVGRGGRELERAACGGSDSL